MAATDAGRYKDAHDAYLSRLGHRMAWTRGHGLTWLSCSPGFRGDCEHCGAIARIADLGNGIVYFGYQDAVQKKMLIGARRCTTAGVPADQREQ